MCLKKLVVVANLAKCFLKVINLLIKKHQQTPLILIPQAKIMYIIILQIYQLNNKFILLFIIYLTKKPEKDNDICFLFHLKSSIYSWCTNFPLFFSFLPDMLSWNNYDNTKCFT